MALISGPSQGSFFRLYQSRFSDFDYESILFQRLSFRALHCYVLASLYVFQTFVINVLLSIDKIFVDMLYHVRKSKRNFAKRDFTSWGRIYKFHFTTFFFISEFSKASGILNYFDGIAAKINIFSRVLLNN